MPKQITNFALLIIDMQNDFVMPGSPLRILGAKSTIPAIQKLLALFRTSKRPIFHAVREYRPDGSDVEITRLRNFMEHSKGLVPGTKGCEIVEELKPHPGEYKIIKNRFSAFMNTELDFILRRLDINHLVICGTQFPGCIRATVFDGISYGYYVTVVTDATSAKTPEIAQANINDMVDFGVTCTATADLLKQLK